MALASQPTIARPSDITPRGRRVASWMTEKRARVMTTRSDRFMSAAARAAPPATQTGGGGGGGGGPRRRRRKQMLLGAGRVRRPAGRAALVAAVAAGIAAVRAERSPRKLPKGR